MLYCLCVSIICLCVPKRIASFVCHRCMYLLLLLLLLLLFVLPAGCTLYARSPIVFDAVGFRLKSGRLRSAEVSLAATGTPRPGSAVLGSGGHVLSDGLWRLILNCSGLWWPNGSQNASGRSFLSVLGSGGPASPKRHTLNQKLHDFSSGCWLSFLQVKTQKEAA